MKHLIDPGPSRKGWHRLAKVLRCPRLYALSYNVEHRTSDEPPAEPLIKGSLMHVGLAHHYAQKSDLYDDVDIYSPADAVEALAQLHERAVHRLPDDRREDVQGKMGGCVAKRHRVW